MFFFIIIDDRQKLRGNNRQERRRSEALKGEGGTEFLNKMFQKGGGQATSPPPSVRLYGQTIEDVT